MSNAFLAIGFARDDCPDAVFLEESAKSISVVSLIGDKLRNAWDQAHTSFRHNAIGSVAGRQHEHPRAALFVDNRMNLAVSTAFGDAYRLRLRPPFPPLAQRWIFTWLLSSATCPGVSGSQATEVNIFCQMPRSLQRAKRL